VTALDLIRADHKQLRSMLAELSKADAAQARANLVHQLRAALIAHEHMEEEIFYPALRSHAMAKAIVLEGYEEHHVIDLILDELVEVPEDSDQWSAKLKVLTENIEHHVDEEESEMFRIAHMALSQEALDELGQKMQASKAAVTA
jgi:hypothetical protein